MHQDIYLIDDSEKLKKQLVKILQQDQECDYDIKIVKPDWLEVALKNIPEIIMVNDDAIKSGAGDYCKKIRGNEDNAITPIIVLSSNKDREYKIKTLQSSVEYFIEKPFDDDELYYIIKNIIRLMYINRTVSPLTGLPGNVQIDAELKKRILASEDFAVLYCDLDNFKSYNDVYGFLKGDEIIKFTANTILKYVYQDKKRQNFVGHIGGDDFIAIIDSLSWEGICQSIIAEFDAGMINFLNDIDKKRGYLEAANRKGIIEQFPITAISIGVVECVGSRIRSILEIGEVGAQVKHAAKSIMGSCYIANRRI